VDYAYQTTQQRSWEYSWNVSAGNIELETDLDNNVTTTYTYDPVGRLKITDEADCEEPKPSTTTQCWSR